MRRDNLNALPPNLPVPIDDGACDHLPGRRLPAVSLPSTAGGTVRLDRSRSRWTVIYVYPRTGLPDQEPPGGLAAWDAIPGARGCTPQTCGYRDRYTELKGLGAEIYGLSTQDTGYQREMAERLRIPFAVLSDARLEWSRALRLPTFETAGMTLIRRLTLICSARKIRRVFFPVFPPD